MTERRHRERRAETGPGRAGAARIHQPRAQIAAAHRHRLDPRARDRRAASAGLRRWPEATLCHCNGCARFRLSVRALLA
jgi:hypothetical protein